MAASIVVPLLTAAPALIKSGIEVAQLVKQNRSNGSASSVPLESRTLTPAKRQRAGSRPRLDEEQRANLVAISQEVGSYPLPAALAASRDALVLALLVNGWVESRLRNGALNDRGERSIGLFQINVNANPSYDAQRLREPGYNTRALLDLIVARATPIERGLRKGASVAALTAAVTYYAERPKDRRLKAEQRAVLAEQWYGSVARKPALGLRF